MDGTFEIRVREELCPTWAGLLPRWSLEPYPAGGTVLRSPDGDQDMLIVALQQLRALRLTLISVVPCPPERNQERIAVALEADRALLDPTSYSLFTAVSDGLAVRDRRGVIVAVNPAYCALYGYSREELLGKINDTPLTSAQQAIFDSYLATVNSGGVFRTSGGWRRRDGERIYVEMRAVPFNYGGAPHILDLARDATAQIRAVEQAEQLATERTRELATLLEVTRQTASTLDLVPLLRTVLTQLRAVLPFDAATFNLCEESERLALMLYHRFRPTTSDWRSGASAWKPWAEA